MNNLSVLHMALRFLLQNLRKGDLTLLFFCLVITTATISSVSIFTSRISNSISQEASSYLGADAKVRGSLAVPSSWNKWAQEQKINTANIIKFRAMAFGKKDPTLVQVKAVSDNFPLRGQVSIAHGEEGAIKNYENAPPIGSIWLASRLFLTLDVAMGDSIRIGDASFIVDGLIKKEPDSVQTSFGFSPRVIMNIHDVPGTNAVQVGSRINHEWLLAGEKNQLLWLKEKIEPLLGDHYKWSGTTDDNRQINQTIVRAEKFLILGSSLSLLLAGVAITLAVRRFIERQASSVAILKTLGVAPKKIFLIYSYMITILGMVSVFLGAVLGWALHLILLFILGDFIATDLASAQVISYFMASILVMATLLSFVILPILSLQEIQPSQILRDKTYKNISVLKSNLVGFSSIVFLLYAYSQEWLMTTAIILSVSVLALVTYGVSAVLMRFSHVLESSKWPWWTMGIKNAKRHQPMTSIQMLVFSTVFMLILALIEVRTELMDRWKSQIPADAPNHFAFNIFESDLVHVKDFLKENNIKASPYYPMTRGRIVSINDTSLEDVIKNTAPKMNYERELNLTWSPTLGKDNSVTKGEWWDSSVTIDNKPKEWLVSVEEDYAKGLKLEIGDTLVVSVAEQKIQAKVASIRKVDWESMNPNFFVIFNTDFSGNSVSNWVTSFYVPKASPDVTRQFIKQFPSISIFDIEQTLAQIQDIISKVGSAIEFILILILCAGIVILMISIQSTLDNRRYESALYRAYGAQKSFVRNVLIVEFALIGLLSGFMATAGAEVILYTVQTRIFDLGYELHVTLWLIAPMVAMLIIASVGYLSTRAVIQTSPLVVIREN